MDGGERCTEPPIDPDALLLICRPHAQQAAVQLGFKVPLEFEDGGKFVFGPE
jgi:hypothetical protein